MKEAFGKRSFVFAVAVTYLESSSRVDFNNRINYMTLLT